MSIFSTFQQQSWTLSGYGKENIPLNIFSCPTGFIQNKPLIVLKFSFSLRQTYALYYHIFKISVFYSNNTLTQARLLAWLTWPLLILNIWSLYSDDSMKTLILSMGSIVWNIIFAFVLMAFGSYCTWDGSKSLCLLFLDFLLITV